MSCLNVPKSYKIIIKRVSFGEKNPMKPRRGTDLEKNNLKKKKKGIYYIVK